MGKKVNVIKLIECYQKSDSDKEKENLYVRIYRKYLKYMKKRCKQISKEKHLSYEDLMQESAITLLKCVKNYNFSTSFIRYFSESLFNNLGNTVIKPEIKWRDNVSLYRSGDLDGKSSAIEDFIEDETYLDAKIDVEFLLNSINKKKHKDILIRKHLLELTFDEVSKDLNCSRQATQQLHERIVEKVREDFKWEV